MRSNNVLVFGRLKSEPLSMTNEAPSAVKSKREHDSISFRSKPVELSADSMPLGGRPASLLANTKNRRDKDHNYTSTSAKEAPSSVMSKSELDTVSFKDKPVDSSLVCQTVMLERRPASALETRTCLLHGDGCSGTMRVSLISIPMPHPSMLASSSRLWSSTQMLKNKL